VAARTRPRALVRLSGPGGAAPARVLSRPRTRLALRAARNPRARTHTHMPPPQVAKQQGEYLADLLVKGQLAGPAARQPALEGAKPFR
jgi:hypothetical protein